MGRLQVIRPSVLLLPEQEAQHKQCGHQDQDPHPGSAVSEEKQQHGKHRKYHHEGTIPRNARLRIIRVLSCPHKGRKRAVTVAVTAMTPAVTAAPRTNRIRF
jgi:hypothetical protein